MSHSDFRSEHLLVEPLSARELEILSHMAENRSNREIADLLVLSLNTVKWYARQIYGKLGVNSRRQAVSRARDLVRSKAEARNGTALHKVEAQIERALSSFFYRETGRRPVVSVALMET